MTSRQAEYKQIISEIIDTQLELQAKGLPGLDEGEIFELCELLNRVERKMQRLAAKCK